MAIKITLYQTCINKLNTRKNNNVILLLLDMCGHNTITEQPAYLQYTPLSPLHSRNTKHSMHQLYSEADVLRWSGWRKAVLFVQTPTIIDPHYICLKVTVCSSRAAHLSITSCISATHQQFPPGWCKEESWCGWHTRMLCRVYSCQGGPEAPRTTRPLTCWALVLSVTATLTLLWRNWNCDVFTDSSVHPALHPEQNIFVG